MASGVGRAIVGIVLTLLMVLPMLEAAVVKRQSTDPLQMLESEAGRTELLEQYQYIVANFTKPQTRQLFRTCSAICTYCEDEEILPPDVTCAIGNLTGEELEEFNHRFGITDSPTPMPPPDPRRDRLMGCQCSCFHTHEPWVYPLLVEHGLYDFLGPSECLKSFSQSCSSETRGIWEWIMTSFGFGEESAFC